MKKSLLFLASLMLATMSVFAQPEMPKVKFMSFADAINTGKGEEATHVQVYLYNVEAGLFLTGGNYWNTRACVVNNGTGGKDNNVTMEQFLAGAANVLGYKWEIAASGEKSEDGVTDCYAFANKTTSNYLTADAWDGVWVDGNTERPWSHWIVSVNTKTNTFEMTYDGMNGKFGLAEKAWGQTGNTNTFFIDASQTYTVTVEEEDVEAKVFEGKAYTTWAVVSAEEYDRVLPLMQLYYKSFMLKKAIDDAKAEYADIDLSEAENIYKSLAEVEDVQKGLDAVQTAINDLAKKDMSKATVENPVDVTGFIVNPSFDIQEDFRGWSEGFGAGGDKYTNAEIYGKSFDVYQDIKDLPGGVYKVTCKGYTRYKSAQEDYDAWKAGQISETKIYLKSDTYGQFFTPVMHVSENGSYTTFSVAETTVTTDAGTLYCPNTMRAADSYFHEKDNPDRYLNTAFGGIAEGDVLRLGVFNNKATGSDWSIFDDFKLYYLGDQLEAYQLWGQTVKDMNSGVSFDEVYYGKPEKDLYEATMKALTDATTKEEITKAIEKASTLADVVTASKENYATYVEAVKAAKEWLATFKGAGEAMDKIADYLTTDEGVSEEFPHGAAAYILDYENGVYEGALTAEEIAAETAFLAEMKALAIANSLKPGDDATHLLTNPSFADGFKGWTKKDGSAASGNVGDYSKLETVELNNNVEVYSGVVDIYQEVKNVPDGVYTLTCKAFERPAANGSYDGSEESKVFLFMNDLNPTPVQNICGDALMPNDDESNIKNLENCYITRNDEMATVKPAGWDLEDYMVEGKGYVPNGMVGAAIAFKAGRYTQQVYGLVEGGTLKIGLTSNGKSAHWVLWTDFTLTYEGSGADAKAIILQKQLENLNLYIENNQDAMTDPAIDAAKAVAETAQKAIEEKDAAAIETSTNAIPEALTAAKANVAAKQELAAALPELEAAYEAEEPNPKGLDAYGNIVDEITDDAIQALTTDQVKALTAKVKEVTGLLKAPIIDEEVTFDKPMDMTSVIVNPDLATGDATGWTLTVDAKNLGYQDNKVYDVVDAIGNPVKRVDEDGEEYEAKIEKFIEGWRPDADGVLGDGEINQIIYGLPAGAYALEVDAIGAWQKDTTIPVTGIFLFAQEGDGEMQATAIATEGGTGRHFTNYFVKKSADTTINLGIAVRSTNGNWVAADNFTLTYYGSADQEEFIAVGIDTPATKAKKNGKYLENGRIVIIRNGMKYNVAGQAIK